MRSRAHEECNLCGKGRAELDKHDAEALRSIDKRRKDFSGRFHEEITVARGNACLLFVGLLSPGRMQTRASIASY